MIKKQFDSFSLVAERVDLFDHISKPIKYGAIIHLKATEKDSLNDFIELNSENIIDVITSQEIEFDI